MSCEFCDFRQGFKMKICALILSLVCVAESFLSCSYFLNNNTYQCDLTINNPNGLNNFTEIGGIHEKKLTNFDVARLSVARDANSVSTNVPSIICDTFPNLVWIDFFNVGLIAIGDGDFASCSRIIQLLLESNNINSISRNAFIALHRLEHISLTRNNLTALPENVFVNQQNLTRLSISSNPIGDIPVGLLRPLGKLDSLFISDTNIVEMKIDWFVNNKRLETLFVSSNRITALPDSFIGLEKLQTLLITSNEISEIRSRGLAGLTNLEVLYLTNNKLTELQADTFLGLGKLIHLFVGNNPIDFIDEKAFRGLDNLRTLNLEVCRIHQIRSNFFENLGRLTSIFLTDNEIEELPEGVFGALHLQSISVSNNRLKILRRNSFGSLGNLNWFDVGSNNINAVDRAIIDDAVRLGNFFFNNNLCASLSSRDFVANRTELLPMLEECFDNYKNIIGNKNKTFKETFSDTMFSVFVLDTTTEGNEEIQLPLN